MCFQIPHVTGGKNSYFWCLLIGPLTLHGMVSVKYWLRSLPLVPIFVALLVLPEWEIIGRTWGKPRCGSLLENFGTPCLKTYITESFRTCRYPGYCTFGKDTFKEKGHSLVLTATGHSLLACRSRVQLPRVNYLILRSKITFWPVANMLSPTQWFSPNMGI